MPKNEPPKHSQWKKGQSGNLKGRPKKMPELEQILIRVLSEEKDGLNAMEAIIRRLRASATAGNIKAAELLLERGYGKVKQKIEMEDTTSKIIVKAKQPPKKKNG